MTHSDKDAPGIEPNPYSTQPAKAFWRSAVGEKDALEIDQLWTPKFPIRPTDVAITAGSCFAQHISRALQENGFGWLDGEPAPPILSPESAKRYNYGVFSFRTGNIYTTKLLHQWLRWALTDEEPDPEVWEKDGRYYDPVRPQIEPNGFGSPEEVLRSREATLAGMRRAFKKANTFVFTLGLTEGWENEETGLCYAACPGTLAGDFRPDIHKFRNYPYPQVRRELAEALKLVRQYNPRMRVLLTVSPVPLTATASDNHVLVATIYSKSTLRAVAGDMAATNPRIDYFPSYEIISSPPYGGQFYAPNKRSVELYGVAHVMKQFFAGIDAQGLPEAPAPKPAQTTAPRPEAEQDKDDLVCEEEMLEFFNGN